ncbi:hypothetical protein JXA84_09200 [candidate division WOR-3 bacterium]|nr:hypothetical protein [candidate division WOR-3 bacterium]
MRAKPVIPIVLVLIFISGFMIGLSQKPWNNSYSEISTGSPTYAEDSVEMTLEEEDSALVYDSYARETLLDTTLIESLTVVEDTTFQEPEVSEVIMEISEEVEVSNVEVLPETTPVVSATDTLYVPIVNDTLERF